MKILDHAFLVGLAFLAVALLTPAIMLFGAVAHTVIFWSTFVDWARR